MMTLNNSFLQLNFDKRLGSFEFFFVLVHQSVLFQKSHQNPDFSSLKKSALKRLRKENKRCYELKGK